MATSTRQVILASRCCNPRCIVQRVEVAAHPAIAGSDNSLVCSCKKYLVMSALHLKRVVGMRTPIESAGRMYFIFFFTSGMPLNCASLPSSGCSCCCSTSSSCWADLTAPLLWLASWDPFRTGPVAEAPDSMYEAAELACPSNGSRSVALSFPCSSGISEVRSMVNSNSRFNKTCSTS